MVDPNWISAAIALAALAFSIIAHLSAAKSRKKADELEERGARLSQLQAEMAQKSWSDTYFRQISEWAGRVSTAISSAIHSVGQDCPEVRRDILSELSACIDMGRWYFPNQDHEKKGVGKEPAYRGVRQPVLDWVVYAYDILDRKYLDEEARDELVRCQRNFVSFIQMVLDPRSREEEITRILKDFERVSSLPQIQSPPE